jgi:hypothetical protein
VSATVRCPAEGYLCKQFQRNNAAINQKGILDGLLKSNKVNKRITTHQEIKNSYFGNGTPSALTKYFTMSKAYLHFPSLPLH